MKNQVLLGTPTSPRFALCPTTVKAGDAVLLGKIPAVALDDYQANYTGTTFYTNGTYALTVVGESSVSPPVNAVIKPGQALYYNGGTLDATTDVTTGGTISADSSGTPFGQLDPQYQANVGSGLTVAGALVRL